MTEMPQYLQRAVAEPDLRVLVVHETTRDASLSVERDARQLANIDALSGASMAHMRVRVKNGSQVQHLGAKRAQQLVRGMSVHLVVGGEWLEPRAVHTITIREA